MGRYAFVELVMQTARLLDVQEVEALMEPTGTYGDPLRALSTRIEPLHLGSSTLDRRERVRHDRASVIDHPR